MVYLESILFPDREAETTFFWGIQRTCYDSFYPFQVLSPKGFSRIDFEPVTILCGGNGSGKTTALNIIAEKLGIKREAPYNRSNFFEDYVNLCEAHVRIPIPKDSRIITSDDVFDYMLNLRMLNQGIDQRRQELFQDYLDEKYSHFQMKSLDDYERLKRINLSRRKSQSQYVRSTLMDNVREHSNGESASLYFTEKIKDNALYFLDEPENSLSPERQLMLADFLTDSARFFGCQFVISTHSPFILAMKGAKIYDLDQEPVDVKKWTRLGHVRAFYDFFKRHEGEFQD